MTLTVLIADDEEAPRAQLAAALQRARPDAHLVARCANGVDAWDAWLEHEPALALLDIRMPGLSGLDVARRIAGRGAVVFVTAHGDHALDAFDAGAVDYVLKPVDDARLATALQRAVARRPRADSDSARQEAGTTAALDPTADLLQRLAAGLRIPHPSLQVIQASVGREVRMIRTDEVVYFESDSRYTRVVHAGGDALIRTPLKELLAQLDESQFWQVHRSVIVNHRHIEAAVRIDEGTMQLRLRGRAETLPVSRHFQARFKGQ